MNYINIFQNGQALSVSVGNSYSEYHLMHILLDNFCQGGEYTAKIANHQAELVREYKFTDRKYLCIKCLQIDYLSLDSTSSSGRYNERENIVQKKCIFVKGDNCSEKFRGDGDSYKQQNKLTPCKYFRCGSVNHTIAKCLKPPKYND